jgi:hypothetical protein
VPIGAYNFSFFIYPLKPKIIAHLIRYYLGVFSPYFRDFLKADFVENKKPYAKRQIR